jgi:hypothetical protein
VKSAAENLETGANPRPTPEPPSRLGDLLVRGQIIDREQLLRDGITSIDEVVRVTSPD